MPKVEESGALKATTVRPSGEDPTIRQAGLDRLRSRIECAHRVGSTLLGGPLYAAHKHFREAPLCDDDYKYAAETLATAAEDAEAAGVTMCLEVLNRFEIALVNTTSQARRICELADHPRVRIHYDTHHGHLEENSHEAAIDAAGPYFAHLHVSESHRGVLGSGLVDWQQVRRAVTAANYDGWCTVEAFSTKVEIMRVAANVHRDTFSSRSDLARSALPFLRTLFDDQPAAHGRSG